MAGTILYVEDEVIDSLETSQLLEEFGFSEVVTAHDLEQARAMVRQKRFSHALLDVNLGNGDRTFDLAEELSRMGVRVVFATGYGPPSLSQGLSGAGYVEKPLVEADLRDALSA